MQSAEATCSHARFENKHYHHVAVTVAETDINCGTFDVVKMNNCLNLFL